MSKTTRRLSAKAHPPGFERLVTDVKVTKNIQEISPAELKAKFDAGDPMLVLDVREDNERCKFFIDGSVHIGKGVIERDIEAQMALDSQNMPIITICSGGFRSALAAASLLDMGYKEVYSLSGGLKGYLEQDFDNIVELEEQYLL